MTSYYLLKYNNGDPNQGEVYKMNTYDRNKRFGFDSLLKVGAYKEKRWRIIAFSLVKRYIKPISSMVMNGSSVFVTH